MGSGTLHCTVQLFYFLASSEETSKSYTGFWEKMHGLGFGVLRNLAERYGVMGFLGFGTTTYLVGVEGLVSGPAPSPLSHGLLG